MNSFRMGSEGAWVIRFERRSGRWVLAPPRQPGPLLVLLEWAVVTIIVCAILVAGLLAGLYQARPDFDVQSKAFADASVSAIAAASSPGEVFARATPDFVDAASDAFYANIRRLSALGPGGVNQGCLGAAAIEPMGVYSPVTARYTCELDSADKRAIIALSLGRNVNDWRITGFYVSPPLWQRSAATPAAPSRWSQAWR